MKVRETPLAGALVIEPDIYPDNRGHFLEVYQQTKYHAIGITDQFVQDNRSFSRKGVVRGLHFQNPNPQGKLMSVASGAIFDVVLDIRAGSPTFGQWYGETLTGENGFQLWVPVGFAHGFMALEDSIVTYKVSGLYDKGGETSIHWNSAGIEWPDLEPILSAKDESALTFAEIDPSRFRF